MSWRVGLALIGYDCQIQKYVYLQKVRRTA
jgi:hypothetical protein